MKISACLTLALLSLTAAAATRTWDGGGGNANWSSAVNWQTDTAPVPGDSLVFPAGALQLISVNDFPAGTAFGTITVSAAYQLSGNGITLSGGFTDNATGVNVLAQMPLKLAGPQTITRVSTGTLSLSGVDTNGQTLTLHTPTTGKISPGVISGAGGIIKTGGGPLTLAGASTYTGITDIVAGTVNVNRVNSLGATGAGAGNTIIAAGAELALTEVNGFTLHEDFSLAGTIRQSDSATDTDTLTGAIVLTGTTATLFPGNQSFDLAASGVISGSGSLHVTSIAGRARLAGTEPNTFTGGIVVDLVKLYLAKTAGVTALPGPVQIGGTTFAGTVHTLSPEQFGPVAGVTMLQGSEFILAGHDQTIAGLTLSRNSIIRGSHQNSSTGTLFLNGNLFSPDTIAGSGGIEAPVVSVGATRTWTVGYELDCDGYVSASLAGGKIIKEGPGRLVLFGGSSAGLELRAGKTETRAPATSPVQLNGGTLDGQILEAGAISSLAGGGTISAGGVGSLHCSSLTLNAATTLAAMTSVDFGGGAAHCTRVEVTGSVSLNSAALTVTLSNGSAAPLMGTVFTLLDKQSAGAVSGTFAGKAQNSFFPAGSTWYQISYTGGTGNDVTLTVVPEPPQVREWDAGGGNGNWNVANNWEPNGTPVSAEELIFGTAPEKAMTNNLSGATFKSLTFELPGYSLAGNAFSLSNGITVTAEDGDTTISGPGITLTADQNFAVTGPDAELILGGANAMNLNGRKLTTAGPGTVRMERFVTGTGTGSKITCDPGSTLFMDNLMLHEGETRVNGGTLVVNNLMLSSRVVLNSGTLAGGGSLSAGLSVLSGVIDPGLVVPGDLTITGNVALGPGTTVRIRLRGASSVSADKLDVNGTFQAGGAALEFLPVSDFAPTEGQTFHLVTNDGSDAVIGTFAGKPQNSTVNIGPHQLRISYTGGSGNDITLTVLTHVSIWDGGGANNNWTNADNWVGNTDIQDGDILVFPDGIYTADNNSATVRDFRSIIVGGEYSPTVSDVGASAPVLKGRRIGLTNGITGGGGVFDLGITLRASQTFIGGTFRDPTILGGGGVDLDRDIKLNGFTLTAVGDATLDKQITGTGAVIKDGGGLARFTPTNLFSGNSRPVPNTFTGTMDIRGGQVKTTPIGLSGAGSPTIIHENCALDIYGDDATNMPEPVQLHGKLTVRPGSDADLTLTGSLDINGAACWLGASGGSPRALFAGPITGNGAVTMEDEVFIAGAAANTFSGGITVLYRTVNGANVLTLMKPANVTALAGSAPITVQNGSSLVVVNANQISDARSVILGDTSGGVGLATFTLQAAETIASLTLEGGQVEGAGLLTVDGPLTVLASDEPARTQNVAFTAGPNTNIREWTVADGAAEEDLIVQGELTNPAGAQVSLVKKGAGLLTVGDATLPGISAVDGTVRGTGFTQGVAWKLDGGRIEGTNSSGRLTTTNNGGTFSPGNGPDGIGLWAAIDLLWNPLVTYECQLADPSLAAGVGYDQVSVIDAVTLNAGQPGGGASLHILPSPDYYPLRDVPMIIVRNEGTDAISGTFKDLPEGATIIIKGVQHRISYTGGTNGNDVTLTALTGTPRRWDGGGTGTSLNWTNPINWEGDQAPRAGDDLIFPAGHAGVTVNNYAASTVFSSVSIEAGGYTFNALTPANTMTLPGGITSSFSSGTSTWAIPLALATDLKITNTQSGLLSFTAAATIAPNGHLLTVEQLQTGAPGNISLAGLISGSGTLRAGGKYSATGGLNFTGVSITGNNSGFTGTVQVFGGLRAAHANALGTGVTGGVTEANGLLCLDHSGGTMAHGIILGSNAQLLMAGGTTLSGTLELSKDGNLLTAAGTGTVTLSGGILGPPAIANPQRFRIDALTATVRFAGAASNNYANPTRLTCGTLELAKTGFAVAVPAALLAKPVSFLEAAAFVEIAPSPCPPIIVRLLGSTQILDTAVVTLGSGAVFDLNNFDDTIGGLDMTASAITTGTGTLTVDGNLTTRAAITSGSSTITGKLAVKGAGRTWNIEDGLDVTDLQVTAVVSSDSGGTITKTGAGRINLTGNNTLTSCTVQEGSVFNTLTSSTNVFLNGGTAGGVGTVGSLRLVTPASSSGTIQPGAHLTAGAVSPGLLSAGQLELGVNAVLREEFTGTTRGSQYDALNASGTVTLGNATLVLDVAFASPPPVNTIFTIIQNTSGVAVSGTFKDLAQGAIFAAGGFRWQVSYTGGASTRDVTLTNLASTGITRTWDGGSAVSDAWSAAQNWVGDVVPNPGDDLVFPAGLAATDKLPFNNYAVGTTFNSIRIEDGGYTFAGGSIALNAGIVCTYTSGSCSWNILTAPAQTQSWSIGGDGQFNVGSSALMSGAAPLKTLTLQTTGAGSGFRFDNVVAGLLNLVKTGPGTVTLNNANTYSGTTQLLGGTLTVQNAGGLGSGTSPLTVNPGTTLALLSSSSISLNRFLVLYGRLLSGGATHSIAGANAVIMLSHTATVEVQPGFILNVNAEIGGADSLRKKGIGTLVIAGAFANPELTDIFVDEGTVQLSKAAGTGAFIGNLTIGGTPGIGAQVVMTASNQIPDAATVTLLDANAQFLTNNLSETIGHLAMTGGTVNTGTGTLTLTGSLTTHAAATTALIQGRLTNGGSGQSVWTIEDGTAANDLHMTGVIGTSGGASMVKRGAGKAVFSGNSTPGNWVIEAGEVHVSGTTSGNLNITGGILSGTGIAGDVFGNTAGTATIKPGGDPGILSVGFFSPHPTTTLRFQINGTGRGTTYDSIDALNDTATLAGTLVLETGGGFIPQRGQTFTLLHGNLNDPPNGNFNGLAEGAAFVQSGYRWHITYQANGGIDTILICDGVAPTGFARLWDGGANGDPRWTTAANWQGDIAPSPGDDLVFPAGVSQTVAVNSFPAGTTFNSLTISGGYTLAESAAGNNGVLLIAGMTVDSSADTSISVPLTLDAAQTFHFSGDDATHRAGAAINTAGMGLTLDSSGTVEMGSVISGAGSLTKTGTGALLLSAANTFTGTATLLGGTTTLTNAAALGTGSNTTVRGASTMLQLAGSGSMTVSEPLTVEDGILAAATPSQTIAGAISGTGTEAHLRSAVDSALALSGVISGPSGWRMDAGSVFLMGAGANTLTGPVTVADGTLLLAKSAGVNALAGPLQVGTGNAGALRLAAANQIPNNVAVTVNGPAAVLDAAGFPETLGTLTMTGGTVQTSSTLILNGGLNTLPATSSARLTGNIVLTGSGTWDIADGSAAPDLICNAALDGSGLNSLDKSGAGSAAFTAANSIQLRIVEGLVTWNSNSPGSNITLAGGTLGGTGTMQKLLSQSAGGLVSPGSSAGTLTCAKGGLDSTITLRMEAAGLTAGTEHDQIICDGNEFGLDDAILDFRPAFTPAVDDSFTLIRGASGISGTFANLPEGALFSKNGFAFQITYRGGGGNDVVVTRIDVPDPEILSFTRTPGTGGNAGSDNVSLDILGTAGLSYLLEVSVDLLTWTILATEPADERGAVRFRFLELQSIGRRFYRARLE